MGKYGVFELGFTTATTDGTAIDGHMDTANDRVEIVECIMTGSSAAAADRQHRASLVYHTETTDAVGTATTPEPFNQGAQAAHGIWIRTATTEGATKDTTFPVMFGFNQRGGMRWAVPRGEGVIVETGQTTMSIAWQVMSDAAGEVDANIHFWNP